MKYLSGLKINSRYARTFENNCAVISRTADGMNMGTCAYHLADGMTCPVHGVVKQMRPDLHRADPPKPDNTACCSLKNTVTHDPVLLHHAPAAP